MRLIKLCGGIAKVFTCVRCRKPAYIFNQNRWKMPNHYCIECSGKLRKRKKP
jgi:hypothetical protein